MRKLELVFAAMLMLGIIAVAVAPAFGPVANRPNLPVVVAKTKVKPAISNPSSVSADGTIRVDDAIERRAILTAIRPAVEKHVLQPVKFTGVSIRTENSFAIVSGTQLKADGSEIDYTKIPEYAKLEETGMFDGGFEVLLQKNDGKWQVLEIRIGPTDTMQEEWMKIHQLKHLVIWGE